jgi:hypothetical protein
VAKTLIRFWSGTMAKKIMLLMFAVAICWSTLGCGPKSNAPTKTLDDSAQKELDAKIKAAQDKLKERK